MRTILVVAVLLLLSSPVIGQELERFDGTVSDKNGTTYKFTWSKAGLGHSYHDVEDHRFKDHARLWLDGVPVRGKDFCLPQHPVRVMTLWKYHREMGIHQLVEVRARTR